MVALISSVEKNGPADKAGIEASDVILQIRRQNGEQFQRLAAHGGGDQTRPAR